MGTRHGIKRCWDENGVLDNGFPEFNIRGVPVTREQYEQASIHDDALPRYNIEDDMNARSIPPEIFDFDRSASA